MKTIFQATYNELKTFFHRMGELARNEYIPFPYTEKEDITLDELVTSLAKSHQDISDLLKQTMADVNTSINDADTNKNFRKVYFLTHYKQAIYDACEDFNTLIQFPNQKEALNNFKKSLHKLSHEKYSATVPSAILQNRDRFLISLTVAAALVAVISFALAHLIPIAAPVFLPISFGAALVCATAAGTSLLLGKTTTNLLSAPALISKNVRQGARLEYQLHVAAAQVCKKNIGLFNGFAGIKQKILGHTLPKTINIKVRT